jgi:SAM-dependent methyltransferase
MLEDIKRATGFSTWQLVAIAAIIVMCINYITLVFMDRFRPEPVPTPYLLMQGPQRDGFGNPKGDSLSQRHLSDDGFVGSQEEVKYNWLNNDQLYDDFYASVYDLLVQSSKRNQAEVAYLMKHWKNPGRILDAGCGTGTVALAFAKEGAQKVVGIDQSKAMIDHALKVNLPKSTLTDEQKAAVTFRVDNLLNPNAAKTAEFDAATIMYFTVYEVADIDGLLRNLAVWIRPGGHLCIQVVNKHKFDPLLDAASPFVFSLQKYSKERLTKSKVNFDKFDYEANFALDEEGGATAEFNETFRFKDGRSPRRQRHSFRMYDTSAVISKAKAAGWFYHGFVDQVKMGFEYSYLLLFSH